MNNKIMSKIISGMLLGTVITYTTPVLALTKEESVYSKLDANGTSYNTIVSSHLINESQEKLINDLSDLINIKNTNGDEEVSQDGNKLVWSAEGSDIYYQGESQKELPIECKVTYELDGEELEAEELAGKSGNVKITIEYTNKDEHIVNINGTDEKLYTPFVVVCGTIIDNDNNRNIKINNGKIIDDGSKTIVMGMSLPGLQESLGISSDKIEIPNTIEITMETTDFELNNIITYVTPKIIEESDLELFDDLDEIYEKVSTLQSSSKQLVNGTTQLKEGTTTLKDGTNLLQENIAVAYNGAEQIRSEVAKTVQTLQADQSDALDEETLQAIEKQAEAGAKLTDAQKTEIANQAKEGANLTEAQKTQIANQAKTGANLTEAQKTQIAEQAKASAKLTETQKAQITEQATSGAKLTEEQKKQITEKAEAGAKLTEAQKTKIAEQAKASAKLTETQKAQITKQAKAEAVLTDAQKSQIIANAQKAMGTQQLTEAEKQILIATAQNTATETAVETALQTAQNTATTTAEAAALQTAQTVATQTAVEVALQTAQTVATQTAVEVALQTAQTIATTTAEAVALQTAQTIATTTAEEVALQTAQTVATTTAEESALQTAQTVATQVAGKTATTTATKVGNQAKQTFTNQVATQMNTLGNALSELTNGMSKLNDGAKELANGSSELNDGATTLANGMNTFDKEGIQTIYDYINGDVKNITTRLEKLQELADEYNNFTMLDDGTQGSVKFIMVMDEIKKEDDSKQDMIAEDKNN